jgi:hypothetical protein
MTELASLVLNPDCLCGREDDRRSTFNSHGEKKELTQVLHGWTNTGSLEIAVKLIVRFDVEESMT